MDETRESATQQRVTGGISMTHCSTLAMRNSKKAGRWLMGVSRRRAGLTCRAHPRSRSPPPRAPTVIIPLTYIAPTQAMSDIEELSTEERVAVVSKYILQAPPGEVNDVVAGELARPFPL